MTSNRTQPRVSIRRPILAVAAVLTVLMLATAAFLGRRSGDGVARAARADGEAHAREALLHEARTTASAAAGRLDELLARSRTAAVKLAAEVERLGPGPLQGGESQEFALLGSPGVLLAQQEDADAPYGIAPRDAAAGGLRALTARREALAVACRMALDLPGAEALPAGVVHVAVWIDGEGLIGHPLPRPETLLALGGRLGPLDAEVIGGHGARVPAWRGPAQRLPVGRVVSYVVPVKDANGRVFGVVVADLDFLGVESALGLLDEEPPHRALLGADGGVLTASPGIWRALAANGEHAPQPGALLNALSSDPDALAARVPIDTTGWTVMAVASPAAVADRADAHSAAGDRAARGIGQALLGFGILFGSLTAVGAVLLAASLRRRLRPLMEAVSAHADGDLDHRVAVHGSDEIATLAEGLNNSAQQLRANLKRLSESKRRLSGLIEHMGSGLVVTDTSDRITFVNPTFAELVQRLPENLQGRCVEELLLPESAEYYKTELARRREGHSGQYEVSWAVPGMRRPRTIVSGIPLYDEEGYFCGSFGVVVDITSRDQAQQEDARARKLRALGAMAGGVAHDFNHVLTIILGNAQLLAEEDLPEDVIDTVRTIESAALDGAERIRRMREFTKLRSAVADGDELDPNDLVRDMALRAGERAEAAEQEHGVTFDLTVLPLAHRNVKGNVSELREALGNIVTNAIQAMPSGGRLVIEAFDRGEDTVGLRVEDDGVGMPPEDIERIFDPFFTTRESAGSSGLGLSIAFGIVRAHGGRIDVRSAPGEGSALTVVLPTRRATEGADAAPPAAPRVLYAAPRADCATPLQRGLQGLGLYVAVMESYDSATAVLADPAIFNTLLVEHDLGSHSGWELARLARRTRPELRIILLSDLSLSPSESQAHNVGIDRILVRPFDARDVHAAIISAAAVPPARPGAHKRKPVVEQEPGPDKRTLSATGEVLLVARMPGADAAAPTSQPEPPNEA